MSVIDEDDLALLAAGFDGALRDTGPEAGAKGLVDLGWLEVLEAAPAQGIAAAFTALGATGSSAAILDDVLAHALGVEPSVGTCVVAPAPARSLAPGLRRGDRLVVDGTVSRRADVADRYVVATVGGEVLALGASVVVPGDGETIDPDSSYRRLRLEVGISGATDLGGAGSWDHAVAAARAALAHQLLGASRTMLGLARDHAVDRVQFGRAVASFQAVRHKLADALVQIEGAAATVAEWDVDADPLLAAVAKSLAGQAARTTATHAQQVLAGIGFTTDHPFHRWLKRTLVLDGLFGSASTLPAEIGAELLARQEAPRLREL